MLYVVPFILAAALILAIHNFLKFDFLSFLLPLYDAEGRYRITIALGCTGGKHRSVAMTEALMRALKRQDYTVSVEHRHMELG